MKHLSSLSLLVTTALMAVLFALACTENTAKPDESADSSSSEGVSPEPGDDDDEEAPTGKSSSSRTNDDGEKPDKEPDKGDGDGEEEDSSSSSLRSGKSSSSVKAGSSSSKTSSSSRSSSSRSSSSQSSSSQSSSSQNSSSSSEEEQVSCPSTRLAPGDQNKTIMIDGKERKYILHVPSAYKGDEPVPLVVDFHPIGGSASAWSADNGGSPYKAKSDPEGVITVYPDGLKGPFMNGQAQAWDVGDCCSDANDTGFVRALVKEVKTLACIDSKRVYATGFSMGGGMSHYSACHLADVFAAVAPAAFDLLQENEGDCKPVRPIPVLSFRSTGDEVVMYNGGLSDIVPGMPIHFLGAEGTYKKWAEINECTGNPAQNEPASGCSTYSNCKAGVEVAFCKKQGGTHEAGDANVGWPWLKQFTLP